MFYNTEVFKANSNRGYEIILFCKLRVYCAIYTILCYVLPCLLISSPQFFHKRVHGIKWDKNELGAAYAIVNSAVLWF